MNTNVALPFFKDDKLKFVGLFYGWSGFFGDGEGAGSASI
jgi:hypothetical protein